MGDPPAGRMFDRQSHRALNDADRMASEIETGSRDTLRAAAVDLASIGAAALDARSFRVRRGMADR